MPQVTRVARKPLKRVVSPKQQRSQRTLSNEVNLLGSMNKPPQRLDEYFILLYGEKGVGKTSLMSQFPGAIIEMFEPRRRNLAIRQVAIKPMSRQEFIDNPSAVHPWRLFQASLEEIIRNGKLYPVIDTIDRAYEACLDCICWEKNIPYPPSGDKDSDYGQTWKEIKDEFESTLSRVLYEGVGLSAISHARRWAQDSETAQESFDMLMPTCSPACWKICKAMTDYNFYYGYEGTHRVLAVRGTDTIWGSAGQEDHFLDSKGEPLFTIPMGRTPAEGYKNLMAAYDNHPPAGYRTLAEVGVIRTNATFGGNEEANGESDAPIIRRKKK